MSHAADLKQRYIHVDLTDNQGVLYVNSLRPRNLRGLWWFIRTMKTIGDVIARAEGCIEYKITLASSMEVIVISYWENHDALNNAYKDPAHIAMMRHTFQHIDDFALANETFSAPITTRYLNRRTGFARAANAERWTEREFYERQGTHPAATPQ